MRKYLLVIASMMMLITSQAFAMNFVAKNIRVTGLRRINRNTVLSYMPVKPGDRVTDRTSDKIIADLYKTGFFSNVSLSRQGDTLVVRVDERPVISKITLSGNKLVPSKNLMKILKKLKIADGYEYNQSTLKLIKTALINEYYAHGKYNARVDISATKEKNNSVALYITISEGLTATIKQIKVIGNHAFSEDTLLGQFQLQTPGWFDWFDHNDQYSSQKLAADLDTLHNYYLDRGYLKMRIDSSHVSLSPDRKHVYITVKITEGAQYHFSGFRLAGHLILPRQKLRQLVSVKSGEIYSKAKIVKSEKAIGEALGEKGYFHAKVQTTPAVNERNKTIFLTMRVTPGQLVYVRHISFKGNKGTNDYAFRRVVTQMEGGLISTKQIKSSKQRLLQYPFVRNVNVTTTPVSGVRNEEDVNYDVTTAPAGSITAGVGYGDVDGLMVNAGMNQQNVFGTGNTFGMSATYSASTLAASMNYYNPYYTKWGVGRGFSAYASRYNADKANIADYATDNYGASVNYSIPIAQHDSIQFGFGLDVLDLKPSSDPSDVIADFVAKHKKDFIQIPINLGWTHNSLDRSIFPTRGLVQSLSLTVSAPVRKQSLEYYKVSDTIKYYHPIYNNFIGKIRAGVGYGNGYGSYDRLPFFKNFYAGGMGTVRGYVANTIGPQDSHANAVGGNLLTVGSAALIFPNPLSHSLRTSVFVDAGNVFDTKATQAERARNKDRSGLRYSTGLEFDWLSPLGMLDFSVAKAINPSKNYDDTTLFQFTMGTSI